LEAQTVKPSRFQGSLFQYKKFNHGGDLLNKKVGKEVKEVLVKNKNLTSLMKGGETLL
jgi:hypothetical protein